MISRQHMIAERSEKGDSEMTVEEIQIRQLTHQHLLSPSDSITVASDLCGIQAQVMSYALHALRIRCAQGEALTQGLVKNWTLRGTLHLFAQRDLPLFMHCNNGKDYRRNEWDAPSFWNQRACWKLSPERQAFFSSVILEALAQVPRTREELKEICRERGMSSEEESSLFASWGGGIRELCERGFIHAAAEEKKRFCLSPEFTPMPQAEAELELARRYFTHYAPATIKDAAYFFGVPQGKVKTWLSKLPVTFVQSAGKLYYFIEQKQSYDEREIPPCLFLAGFDALMLGYEKRESLYLKPEYLRGIFTLSGMVMPAILLHGQVVGKWKKKNGRLSIELFTTLERKDRATVAESASSLWSDLVSVDGL